MKGRIICVSQELNQLLDKIPPEIETRVFDLVEDYEKQFKEALAEDAINAMIAIHNLFDEQVKQDIKVSSCKRGCTFCCHQNVDIWPAEAAVIVRYCEEHNIKIDLAYLERQMSIDPMELPKTEVSACVFLKYGDCSIYEARPIKCRTYHVSTDPDFCNLKKYGPAEYKVQNLISLYLEILISALINAVGHDIPAERMPKMLLKHLHYNK
jgi:Fe-S-cluster containining protein